MKYFIKIWISKTNFRKIKNTITLHELAPSNCLSSARLWAAEQDSIRYDANPPNSSPLKEEFICNDAIYSEQDSIHYDVNLDLYNSPNPESQCSLCPIKYLARNPESYFKLQPSFKTI